MYRFLLASLLAMTGSPVVINVTNFLHASQAGAVRQPAAAGTFYPANPDELSRSVRELSIWESGQPRPTGQLVALISPHAGYVYSGKIAGQGYSLLSSGQFERVIVISPSHVEAFRQSSVYKGRAYETPLGTIPVDSEFCQKLVAESKTVILSDIGHRTEARMRGEHALEVQLPFLQARLGAFQLVPIVMGDQSYENCLALGKALAKLVVPGRDLIVASSDLSHFHPYHEAVALDQKVVRAVNRWDYMGLSENLERRQWEACGGGPIVAAMIAAERLGANQAVTLKYANSGDIPQGDKSRVVGYLSAALMKSDNGVSLDFDSIELSAEDQQFLLETARLSVAAAVKSAKMGTYQPEVPASLREEAGVFVTLTKQGRLRGCVGSIVATESLPAAVATSAANASLNDRRFPQVRVDELDSLEYEISILSPFRRVTDVSQIQPGKHGLLIERGPYRGLLLPQVATEHHWDRTAFLENTCIKAGLPKDAWSLPDAEIYAFSAYVFGERHSIE